MKKKLLTVLLAVVMVFGVFSLAACGGAKPNPADDYNYYRSAYASLKDEEDIRIHSMVFMQLTMMLRTPGQYLIYTGGAWDSKAQANIKAVNDLAKEYDVQVYNLDLKLDGGVTSKLTDAQYAQYTKETFKDGTTVVNYADGLYLNSDNIASVSAKANNIRKALQAYLGTNYSHGFVKEADAPNAQDIPEAALISLDVTGAPSSTSTTAKAYRVWDAGKGAWINFTMSDIQYGTVAATATTPDSVLADFKADLSSLNLTYDDGSAIAAADVFVNGEVTSTSTSYKVTTKEGKIGTDKIELERVIQSIALTVPSFGGGLQSGTDNNNGPYSKDMFDASVIDAFDYFGDYRLHMAGDYDTATDGFLEGSDSVYEVITYAEFIDILKNLKEGDYNVFFGGAWCPNTQSIAKITSDLAKDYGIKRIFFFDPNLDGSASVYLDGKSVSTGMNIRTSNQTAPTKAQPVPQPNTTAANMTFAGLYNYLLDTIAAGGQKYQSYWNVQWKSDMLGRGNRYQLFINGKVQTRMCVPNIMGFTGTANGGKLEVWKEAEYYWADTSVEDSPVRIAWDNAVKTVFEANDYAYYQPLPRVDDSAAAEEPAAGGSTPPAADAGGC